MTHTYKWLRHQTAKASNSILFIDAEKTVSYADNLEIVTRLINFFHKNNLGFGAKIVYIGQNSIAAYQLYFACISLASIWTGINPNLQRQTMLNAIKRIDPDLIVCEDWFININNSLSSAYKIITIKDLFANLHKSIVNYFPINQDFDYPISYYVVKDKIIVHTWQASLTHAKASVKRFALKDSSRLYSATTCQDS